MKEKLPRFLRKRCAPSQWMGMRTLEERVSQRCPDLQRNRERGKSQSCGPCALMARQRTLSRTSPCRQPPKSLHCQNHRPRTKANGKFYLKPRQLPFSSSVDRTSAPGLHWAAARMLPAVEENAATASAASRMTHRPWCLQGQPRKWRKRTSLFTRAQMDRCRPT